MRVVKGPVGDRLWAADGRRRDRHACRARSRRERRGTYDLAFGQYLYNKQHVNYGASDEQVGFLIEGIRVSNAGFKELDRDGGDTGFTRNEWMVKASYLIDPAARIQNEISLKLGYSDETSNETYLGVTDADFACDPVPSVLREQDGPDGVAPHGDRADAQGSLLPRARHDDNRLSPRLHRIWRKVNGFRGLDIAEVLADPTTGRNTLALGALRERSTRRTTRRRS